MTRLHRSLLNSWVLAAALEFAAAAVSTDGGARCGDWSPWESRPWGGSSRRREMCADGRIDEQCRSAGGIVTACRATSATGERVASAPQFDARRPVQKNFANSYSYRYSGSSYTSNAYYRVTQSPSDSNACEREFLRCAYRLYAALGLLGLISSVAGIVYRFREKIWLFQTRAARAAVRPAVNAAAIEDEHNRTVMTVYPNQAFSAGQNFGAATYGNANSYPIAYPPPGAQMSELPPRPFTAYPPPPYPSAPPPYPDESALYQNAPPPHPDGFTSYPPAYPAQVPPKYD